MYGYKVDDIFYLVFYKGSLFFFVFGVDLRGGSWIVVDVRFSVWKERSIWLYDSLGLGRGYVIFFILL